MKPQKITLKLEIHDEDVLGRHPWPMPQTGLLCVVELRFAEGTWIIEGEAGGVPFLGAGDNKIDAILNFFRARLGIGNELREGKE